MVSEKDIIRYLRVKALAEKGVEGERLAASAVLRRLEKKFPGVRKAAADYEVRTAEATTSNQGPPPPPGVHRKDWVPPSSDTREATGNWDNIFSWAQGFAQDVYGFAQTVGNALAGRHLAENHVRSSVRVSRTNHVLLTLRMSMETYERAANLNQLQQRAFRESLHEMLTAELDSILSVDEDDQ